MIHTIPSTNHFSAPLSVLRIFFLIPVLCIASGIHAQLSWITDDLLDSLRQDPPGILHDMALTKGNVRFNSDIDGYIYLGYDIRPIKAGQSLTFAMPGQFTWRFFDTDTLFSTALIIDEFAEHQQGATLVRPLRLKRERDSLLIVFKENVAGRLMMRLMDKWMVQISVPEEHLNMISPFELSRYECTMDAFSLYDEYMMREDTLTESFIVVTSIKSAAPYQRNINYRFRPDASSRSYDEDMHPVVFVSYHEATAFCNWLSSLDARFEYRLPTSKEWHYAAGEGQWIQGFPWPDSIHSALYANLSDQSLSRYFPDKMHQFNNGWSDSYAWTAPVGAFVPNRFGLFDIMGNVAEWVIPSESDFPKEMAMAMGGHFLSTLQDAKLPAYGRFPVNQRQATVGFRIARIPALLNDAK